MINLITVSLLASSFLTVESKPQRLRKAKAADIQNMMTYNSIEEQNSALRELFTGYENTGSMASFSMGHFSMSMSMSMSLSYQNSESNDYSSPPTDDSSPSPTQSPVESYSTTTTTSTAHTTSSLDQVLDVVSPTSAPLPKDVANFEDNEVNTAGLSRSGGSKGLPGVATGFIVAAVLTVGGVAAFVIYKKRTTSSSGSLSSVSSMAAI